MIYSSSERFYYEIALIVYWYFFEGRQFFGVHI